MCVAFYTLVSDFSVQRRNKMISIIKKTEKTRNENPNTSLEMRKAIAIAYFHAWQRNTR